ncbi:MAG: fibrobacter succinogenes major paralogous domain-containing protein [Mariniphaga sp.]
MTYKLLISIIAMLCIAINSIAQVAGTFKDPRDGKIYKTVKIGTQTWMGENLALKADEGCWAYKNLPANVAVYGYLYDWKTAKDVCPSGWHLPSIDEWEALKTQLGEPSVAAGKLKETGITHWKKPNTEATNASGFTALPGGCRTADETYEGMGLKGFWWSSTQFSKTNGQGYRLDNDYEDGETELGDTSLNFKTEGLSVRCIQD